MGFRARAADQPTGRRAVSEGASSAPRRHGDSASAVRSTRRSARHYLYQPEPGDKLVAMSPMRKQIAEHMVWSQQIRPR
jgi:pyruvate/2-oxoglutarate dehydrogenase complex dihydrolipoamide acyltransferase (E2) component